MSLAGRIIEHLDRYELKHGYTGVKEVDVDLAVWQLLVITEAYNRIHEQEPLISAAIDRMINA